VLDLAAAVAGEHLPSLAACPQLRTLDICYGGGVEYPAQDPLDRCLSQHGSCLPQLATLHVRRYNPKETVDFSLPAHMDIWAVGSFLPSEVTALTSLTRLSATDWGYYVYSSCWKDLGTLPQLQVITGAVCCDWAPLAVSLPALQEMACRVVYRPLTPELLLPLLLRALPALRQLEVVLESPPLPPVLKVRKKHSVGACEPCSRVQVAAGATSRTSSCMLVRLLIYDRCGHATVYHATAGIL
jgi:hypothetical protein